LKDIETRLIAELLKNSRRSDRELAKVLRASQPTITRARRKLEKESYIREFSDTGFQQGRLSTCSFHSCQNEAKPFCGRS
jgi:DNA-binding transcriptional regulator YhcF (GntR family)